MHALTLLLALVAVEPRPILAGPATAAVGELVVLQYGESQGDAFSVEVLGAPITPLLIDTTNPQRRQIALDPGRAGRWEVLLIAVGDGKIATARHAITFGEGPSPGPGPQPEPGPTPPPPDPQPGRFGLSPMVKAWVVALVQGDGAQRKAAAARLAKSFRALSARIAAGALTDPAKILNETRAASAQALAGERDAWLPWSDALAGTLDQASKDKKLVEPADFAEAWGEIAAGLEAVP